MKNKTKKICFAASSGGHFEQLLMLRPLMEKYDSFIVTEKTLYDTNVENKRMYFVKQVNRKEKTFLFKMIANSFKAVSIYFKEKPDIIITTGVMAMIPLCLISKLFGKKLEKLFRKKLIYIESFAKVTSPTETGKFLYRYADRFYVQWESLLEIYPDAICLGGIY